MPDLAAHQHRFAVSLADGMPCEAGLSVYRNTIAAAALDALITGYPIVRRILGATAFDAFAHDYAAASPPISPVMATYGAGFGEWLEAQSVGRTLGYLPAVAEIDWMRAESHVAPDAEPIDAAELAQLPTEHWAADAVTLHPATRFAWFTLPAPSIWLAHLDEAAGEIAPEWKAEGILVTRPHGKVIARRIDAATHRVLFGLRLGEPILAAASAAAQLYPDADLAALFGELFVTGALSSLKRKGTRQ